MPLLQDLERIASLMRSEHRELCYYASLCLRVLLSRYSALMPHALLAVARMLLACDGSAAAELQRALQISYYLVSEAIDSLLKRSADAGLSSSPPAAGCADTRTPSLS